MFERRILFYVECLFTKVWYKLMRMLGYYCNWKFSLMVTWFVRNFGVKIWSVLWYCGNDHLNFFFYDSMAIWLKMCIGV